MKIVTRAIILNNEGKVLLGKRARTDSIGSGQWAILGGKPDPGETFEQAIVREVYEGQGSPLNQHFTATLPSSFNASTNHGE
jgi:ADP-ribose pyrophosphatase YjhB (NUDIX family)